jgi:hypothetical protein
MKTKDLLTIATVALGTATITVAAFWARPTDAGNDADAPPPKIAKALLVSRGVQLGIAPTAGRAFKAGDQPEFELTAVNTTEQLASVSLSVALSAAAPPNAMARVILMPSVLCQRQECITLNPRETKVLAMCANTNLPANRVITVTLRALEPKGATTPPQITALSFSTAAPTTAPVVAAAR